MIQGISYMIILAKITKNILKITAPHFKNQLFEKNPLLKIAISLNSSSSIIYLLDECLCVSSWIFFNSNVLC